MMKVGDELTIKDEGDYRGERRFDSDDIRHVAKKLGIQVNDNFGGRSYDYNYYEDLIPVFDNIGIELDHDDLMDRKLKTKYMKKLILFIGLLLLTGCSTTYHLSTLNHDPIYDTVLVVPAGVQIDTLSSSQLRWKLRTDFRFRYDFAQYALSQPRSFDWNNRVLGNRYNVY